MADEHSFEKERVKAEKTCRKILKKPVSNRNELKEALSLAIRYGHYKITQNILDKGHQHLLAKMKVEGRNPIDEFKWLVNELTRPWDELEGKYGEFRLEMFSTLTTVFKEMNSRTAIKLTRNLVLHTINELSSDIPVQSEDRTERIKFLNVLLSKTLTDDHRHVDMTILEYKAKDHTDSPEQDILQSLEESNIEEVKSHPAFAAVVNEEWETGHYFYIHFSLFITFLFFLLCLTTALVLAAKSTDPRHYVGVGGVVQGCCEALVLLYILLAAVINSARYFYFFFVKQNTFAIQDIENKSVGQKMEYILWKIVRHLTLNNIFKFCGRLSILLIIPLRLTGSPWQWVFAALALTFCSYRIFYYISVFSFTGRFVSTLSILMKRDILWLIGILFVLVFALGGGLYFALVAERDFNSRDLNSTRDFKMILADGIGLGMGGSLSKPEGWLPVTFYFMLVFTISLIFDSIVVALFTNTYAECTAQAKVIVVLNKNDIMIKILATLHCLRIICGFCFTCLKKARIYNPPTRLGYSILKPKRESSAQRLAAVLKPRYKYLKAPYTMAEVDYRPVSVSMMQEMRVDIINEVENKFASLMELMKEEFQKVRREQD